MIKKRIFALFIAICMIAALSACGGNASGSAEQDSQGSDSSGSDSSASAYDQVKLKLSCNGTDTANDTKTAKLFAQLVNEKSGGNIEVTVFGNDQLAGGDMQKGLELVLNGTVDLDCHSTSIISSLSNKLMVSTLPWLFKDYQAAEDAFWGSGGEFVDSILETKGLEYLGAVHNGFKLMTCSKRQIKSPEDLKGLKIRIPGGEFFSEFYKAYGASPQAMPWAEVFAALQQGTIDGHDNSISTCFSNNIQEVQEYFTVSHHTYEAFTFMANKEKFNALSPDTQQLIRDCIKEACLTINKEIVSNEDSLIQKCIDEYDSKFYYFTDEDVTKWRAVIEPLIEEYKGIYGEEACKAFNVQ